MATEKADTVGRPIVICVSANTVTAVSTAAKTATIVEHNDGGSKYAAIFVKLQADATNYDHRNVIIRSAAFNDGSDRAGAAVVDGGEAKGPENWFFSLSFKQELACGSITATSTVLSVYSALGALREEFDEVALMGSWLLEHPRYMAAMFTGATVDVIAQPRTAQQTYVNPFAANAKDYVVAADRVFCHIHNIRLSAIGRDAMKRAYNRFFDE